MSALEFANALEAHVTNNSLTSVTHECLSQVEQVIHKEVREFGQGFEPTNRRQLYCPEKSFGTTKSGAKETAE